MNSISGNEIDRLREWASESEDKNVFAPKGEREDTFWKQKERQDTYIMEYDFETISEFEEVCDSIFEKKIDSMAKRAFSVAAFKYDKNGGMEQGERNKTDHRLPEHIYVF